MKLISKLAEESIPMPCATTLTSDIARDTTIYNFCALRFWNLTFWTNSRSSRSCSLNYEKPAGVFCPQYSLETRIQCSSEIPIESSIIYLLEAGMVKIRYSIDVRGKIVLKSLCSRIQNHLPRTK